MMNMELLDDLIRVMQKSVILARKIIEIQMLLQNMNITGEQLRFEIRKVLERDDETNSKGKT